jgi:hypothetical protein
MSLEKVLEKQFQIQEQLFKMMLSREEYFKVINNSLKYSYGFQLDMWKLWFGCNKD